MLASTPKNKSKAQPADRPELTPVDLVAGVVIGGDEPTLHPSLAELCGLFKETGFAVKLDTNGYRYQVIAVDLDRLRRSIRLLYSKSSGLAHEFRSTIWPTWHGPSELQSMGQEPSNALRHGPCKP